MMGPLASSVQETWRTFLEVYEPFRPELYRYCRCLTRSPWDAEDLLQDTMARAFVTLGGLHGDAPNPKAWLLRVASNLWIDRCRRAEPALGGDVELSSREHPEPRAAREAAGTLLTRLAPQERAALVLKDVFELSLADIALALATSEGGVKAALSRGRTKLGVATSAEPETEPVASPQLRPAPKVLDAFCEAFNDRDLARLTALLLDSASVELVGLVTEYGAEATSNPHTGTFHHMLQPLGWDPGRGGVAPRFLVDDLAQPPRASIAWLRGEPLVVARYQTTEGPVVRNVLRLELEDGRIRSVRSYFFTPEVVAEVGSELAAPFRVNGYRYWSGS